MAKRKMEFSKKIFVGVSIGTVVVTAVTLVISWRTGDTSPLAYLIPAVFAEFATATAFYYGKAKEENKIKLAAYLKQDANAGGEEEQ
jgi:hypothetical protein